MDNCLSFHFLFLPLRFTPSFTPNKMAGASINLNPKARTQGFSARFVCLTGKKVQGNLHPIRLQLIHNGKIKRYTTKEACTLEQWDEDAGRIKARVKGATQTNGILSAIEVQASGIVDTLVVSKALSLENFDTRYRNPRATEDVVAYMLGLEAQYRVDGKSGTAACFHSAATALNRFTDGKPVPFADLTGAKLEKLERYLRNEGCKTGGIAVYMRMIRVAINMAIKNKLMHPDQYPFETTKTKGYSMKSLKSNFSPRALSASDMDKLKAFPFDEHPILSDTVRLFLFSYHARGMNFRDMALAKHSQLQDGRLIYTRMKTKAKGQGANFSILVTPPMAEILDHFHDAKSPYLFPLLKPEHRGEAEVWKRTKDALRLVNRHLKAIATILEIEGDFTFYVARHSYAMDRKRKGIAIGKISESMGHESEAITHAYLKSFSNEELDAANANT